MNELQAILAAHRQPGPWALATVVAAQGSTYRKAGARMLIGSDGQRIGAISGGCLERAVIRKAQWVISQTKAVLVEYDAAEDGGFGLGCGGVVAVLIEPLHPKNPVIPFIQHSQQTPGVLATVLTGEDLGQHVFCTAEGPYTHTLRDQPLAAQIAQDAERVLAQGHSQTTRYAAGIEVFLELLQPPPVLVIAGAGTDAVPLAHLAQGLGWRVTVIDTRSAPGIQERFQPLVTLVQSPYAQQVVITPGAAVVVMTHHFQHDQQLLQWLWPQPLGYLGVLGPRQRTEALLTSLHLTPDARLHAPIGLDIGAQTPEEIALCIVAEVKAVLTGRKGGFLRDRLGPIHV